jgi:hypothetical protein
MDIALRPQFAPRLRTLHWYEIALIAAVALALCIFLPIVVKRVLQGFGDVQMFFRAGWAVWTGYPLYEVADHHGWTYHYPPTFALLMGPFAEPLDGFARPAWALSLQASVAVWYALSAIAILAALDLWARALARFAPQSLAQDRWNGWWLLRLGALTALLPFFGDGLGRGQPTALVLLTMVGFLVAYFRGRIYLAACALAFGFTIKLFPLALLIFPLLRRDFRTVLATAGFSLVFLVVVPVLFLGPAYVMELYAALWSEHLSGVLTGVPAPKIAAEITFTSYDMISVGAMLARIGAGGLPQTDALPAYATAGQLAFNAIFIAALLALGHGRFWRLKGPQPAPSGALLIGGALLCAALPVMLSVSQPNYVAFAAPLFAVVQLETWRKAGRVRAAPLLIGWMALMWLGMIASEGWVWGPLQTVGLVTPSLVLLLLWGLICLRREPHALARPGPIRGPGHAHAAPALNDR